MAIRTARTLFRSGGLALEKVPIAWEYPWTLGAIVSAVAAAGLRIQHLAELPDHFWPEFPSIAPELLAHLPHTFLLSARKPTT